jgi:hypothetical protein
MLARKTSKNQLGLPKAILDNFPGIEVFDATVEENRIVLTPIKAIPAAASVNTVRAKMKKLGIVPQDVAEAVQWARK